MKRECGERSGKRARIFQGLESMCWNLYQDQVFQNPGNYFLKFAKNFANLISI
jgi:hypothetical protein